MTEPIRFGLWVGWKAYVLNDPPIRPPDDTPLTIETQLRVGKVVEVNGDAVLVHPLQGDDRLIWLAPGQYRVVVRD